MEEKVLHQQKLDLLFHLQYAAVDAVAVLLGCECAHWYFQVVPSSSVTSGSSSCHLGGFVGPDGVGFRSLVARRALREEHFFWRLAKLAIRASSWESS
jgi:hypothetical protein